MWNEFKAFIMRGNVIDLSIAVIIGGAFGAVVSGFTADIMMPLIGMIIGNIDFSDMKLVLKAAEGETPEVAVSYGKWITSVINFLIIAWVLFIVIKAKNKLDPPAPAPEPAPAGPSETDLLKEIRDLLKK